MEAMKSKREELGQIVIRPPSGMRERIKAAAEANNRSMNAEIVATLEERYPAPVEDLGRQWFALWEAVARNHNEREKIENKVLDALHKPQSRENPELIEEILRLREKENALLAKVADFDARHGPSILAGYAKDRSADDVSSGPDFASLKRFVESVVPGGFSASTLMFIADFIKTIPGLDAEAARTPARPEKVEKRHRRVSDRAKPKSQKGEDPGRKSNE